MVDSCAKLEQSVASVRGHWSNSARVGLILGTGLGHLADVLEADVEIPFGEIAHFPRATALSHAGHLVCGRLAGVPVAAMRGRCHLYEGYTAEQVALPVRLLHALGCELLIVSNAAGGLNPQFSAGDIVVVTDHINLLWSGPRWQTTPDAPRPGRGDASPYDAELGQHVVRIARRENFALQRGVYVAMTGPMYETRAEYRFLRKIGGDVVGMSTVPEVIAARACPMRVLALSIVTNVASPDALRHVSGEQVVAAASATEPRIRRLVVSLLEELAVA